MTGLFVSHIYFFKDGDHRVYKFFQHEYTAMKLVARIIEGGGLLERQVEYNFLVLDQSDGKFITPLHGHAITYRVKIGSQQGCKVFDLQTLLPVNPYSKRLGPGNPVAKRLQQLKVSR